MNKTAVDFPLENLCLTEKKKSRSLQLLQAAERYVQLSARDLINSLKFYIKRESLEAEK